jgi:hypothetical protein
METTVYANNQKEAITFFKENNLDYNIVPTHAEYAGTKHGAKVYIVYFRERR